MKKQDNLKHLKNRLILIFVAPLAILITPKITLAQVIPLMIAREHKLRLLAISLTFMAVLYHPMVLICFIA
jgi:hypothetical protein